VWPDARRETWGRISLDHSPRGVRNIAVDGRVVVAQLYPAVRAPDWRRIDLDVVRSDSQERSDALVITTYQEAPGRLRAIFQFELSDDATMIVKYELDALTSQALNRWGLNICLDARYWACAGVELAENSYALPAAIGPQRLIEGGLRALFPSSPTLTARRPEGDRLRLASAGLRLEVEDQRNWTDPTFKIYSGSLQDPRPLTLEPGASCEQTLELTAETAGPVHQGRTDDDDAIPVSPVRQMPRVGVQLNVLPDSPTQLRATLDDLAVDHVRLDTERYGVDALLGALPPIDVELAVLSARGDAEDVEEVTRLVDMAPKHVRILWHLDSRRTTGLDETAGVRMATAESPVEVIPGTDAYFADLNRDRPQAASAISFSVTPTVHTDDSETVFASLETQAMVVRQAQSIFDAHVVVSPITWAVRGEPETCHDARHRAAGSAYDPRSGTLEGAAWTLGSVHALLSAGAESGTWHELYGANGLVEGHGMGGAVRPTFHAIAALQAAERPRARALNSPGSAWVGIHLVDRGRLIVASLRPWQQVLELHRLPVRVDIRRRLADQELTLAAQTHQWWDAAQRTGVRTDREVPLQPFEISLFDLRRSA